MTILVTGATGTTGSETVRALQRAGAHIRVGARNIEKAKALKGANTDFVEFDLERPETYAAALRGAEKMYLCTPMDRYAHDRAFHLIDIALEQGVQHIVKLSAAGADSVPGITLARWHRASERYLMASGTAWTILRPAGFMANFGTFWGGSIKSEGRIYLPLGNGKVSFIDTRDIADVAAKVLTTNGHFGKIYNLTGGEALDVHTIARQIGDALGKNVTYVDVNEAQAKQSMAGMPDWAVESLMSLFYVFKNNWAAGTTPDVAMVLGRKPRTFAEFVKDNLHYWK